MTAARGPDLRHAAASGAEQAAVWQAADAAARPFEQAAARAAETAASIAEDKLVQAQRFVTLALEEDRLAAITERWQATGSGQFAGRLFEWWHEASHNLDATGTTSARTWLTDLGGPGVAAAPHSPVDLGAVDGHGATLAEYQAKAVADTAERVRQLADDKYAELRLLVPEDHAAQTHHLLDRRLAQTDADFLKRADYESVQDRLTDHIDAGGASSQPIDSETLRAASDDPRLLARTLRDQEASRADLLDGQASDAAVGQVMADLAGVGAAAFAGGATGAAVSGLVSAVRHTAAVRAGTMSPTAAAVAAVSDAMAGFVRSAYVGGVGQGITVLASRHLLPDVLASGALPMAMAKASWDLGQITARFARGELSAEEAAVESAVSLTATSLMWAGAALGQTVIPVPVVGALIGGMVGSLCSSIAVRGITTIARLATEARAEAQTLAALEVELAASLIVHAEERRLIAELSRAHELRFAEIVAPALDEVDAALLLGDADRIIRAAGEITEAHDQHALFGSVPEFQDWMADPATSLVLRVGPAPRPAAGPARAT